MKAGLVYQGPGKSGGIRAYGDFADIPCGITRHHYVDCRTMCGNLRHWASFTWLCIKLQRVCKRRKGARNDHDIHRPEPANIDQYLDCGYKRASIGSYS